MRAGYKVAAAGFVAVLGCAIVAFTPLSGANSADMGSAAQDTELSVSAMSSSSDEGAGDAAPAYRDGVYRASARGKGGDVPVTVTVSGGKITDVVVGENSEVPAMADKAQSVVIPQIIESQSTQGIEAATGATFTSDAIIAAVSKALAHAEA